MIRCYNCQKEINFNFPDIQYNDWLILLHYFMHEKDEEEITDATYESMVDALMSVKPRMEDEK